MRMSKPDTISLLGKWRDEGRIIQGMLAFSDNTSASTVGRIVELTRSSVKITGEPRCGILLNFTDVLDVEFEDYRAVPAEFKAQLQEASEAFLLFRLPQGHCQLLAYKTPDELPK